MVEDEKELAELIRDYLEQEGFIVSLAFDGNSGLEKFESCKPLVAILDIMLPQIDGLELCRIIRGQSNIPIIMLSAKKSDIDKVVALGIGADDYITKPFSPSELVARVKAHIRRSTHLSAPRENKGVI